MKTDEDMERCAPAGRRPNRPPERRDRRCVDAPLTARADLLGVRKALLHAQTAEALRQVDWLADCIEEYMAEGGL